MILMVVVLVFLWVAMKAALMAASWETMKVVLLDVSMAVWKAF